MNGWMGGRGGAHGNGDETIEQETVVYGRGCGVWVW